ncbi:hypothetical protein RUND412_001453 [Rhizina undulata]
MYLSLSAETSDSNDPPLLLHKESTEDRIDHEAGGQENSEEICPIPGGVRAEERIGVRTFNGNTGRMGGKLNVGRKNVKRRKNSVSTLKKQYLYPLAL